MFSLTFVGGIRREYVCMYSHMSCLVFPFYLPFTSYITDILILFTTVCSILNFVSFIVYSKSLTTLLYFTEFA